MRYLIIICLLLLVFGSQAFGETEIFIHEEHNEYLDELSCETCHVKDSPFIVPERKVCYECHDQEFADAVVFPSLKTHGPLWAFQCWPAARGEHIDCSACHEQDWCLECHKAGFADEMGKFGNSLSNIHRSDFQVSHPIAARTDPQLCNSCHESGYCEDCHDTFRRSDLAFESHRKGWSDGPVFHDGFTPEMCDSCHPDNSVLPSHDWSNSHAREARKNLMTCQACHPDGDICLTCHSARSGISVNPHPDDWDDIKGRLERASDGRTCRKCH
ncbi:MAG: cytochrome C [Desulfuromonas sp.]|nr:MAG: cytochrome C [Desulfuromonas sp.]